MHALTTIPTLGTLEGIGGGIVLAIVGMLIVFVGLSIIAMFISWMNRVMADETLTTRGKSRSEPAPAPPQKPKPNATPTPKPSPEPQVAAAAQAQPRPASANPVEPTAMPDSHSQTQSVSEPEADSAISGEVIALIAAAATAAIRRRVRVRQIRVLGQPGLQPWVLGGRMSMMNSHKALLRRPRS